VGGAPIIEEWTAWLLVREREQEFTRKLRLKDAEQARTAAPRAKILKLPTRPQEVTRPPRGRRAA